MEHLAQTRTRALIAASLVAMAASAFGQIDPVMPGRVMDPVPCSADPAQSYALYVPSHYTADRRWPVIYCFDPIARGRVPVERLRVAAEKFGYIIVGSNNSRNGPLAPTIAAANALFADTQRRLAIERTRIYLAGFSGGARAALAMAGAGKFAGVLACSGGFPGSNMPPQVPFVVFGTAGRTDFNYAEMIRLGPLLDGRRTPNRVAVFDGGHEWPPVAVADEALAWFDLQAMRRGLVPRDDAAIRQQFQRRLAAVSAFTGPADESADAYRAVIADFSDLLDTGELVARVVTIEKSREYRRAVTARNRAIRDEEYWRDELLAALHHLERDGDGESPDAFPELAREPPPTGDTTGDNPDAERRTAMAWQPYRPTVSLFDQADAFSTVRRLAASLRRRIPANVAAARALGGVFGYCMTDGASLYEAGQFAASARAYEAATILRPDAGWSYFEWARACAAAGDRKRARELLLTATAKGYADRERIAALQEKLDPGSVHRSASVATAAALPTRDDAVIASPAEPRETRPTASTAPQPAEMPRWVQPAAPARLRDPDVVCLDEMRVAGKPIGSFGISLQIFAVPETKQINRIVIYDVVPDSEAAGRGVRAGDEIVRVNGRTIHEFVVAFDRESEFGRLFVGRKPGDQITLELGHDDQVERRITLTEGAEPPPPWLRWR